MSELKIVYHPDPRLKQKSNVVTDFDNQLKDNFNKMVDSMDKNEGIGLAGVQVGIMQNIIVVDAKNCGNNEFDMLKMANLEVIWASEETEIEEEGCLSYPTIRVEVSRPKEVEVSYNDENGVKHTIKADGLLARCIQHEIDHTKGITLIDYVKPTKRPFLLAKVKAAVEQKARY